jgi:hypothetical protein
VGRATRPLAGSAARRLRPLNALVKPDLTRNGDRGGHSEWAEKRRCPCPRGESASGLAGLPDTGRSPGRRGSRESASDPSRRRLRPRWALGAVLFVRLRGSGSAENLQTERAARKIRPGGSPTARILPDAGLLVVWRQGQRGCFGEARAHRQRTEPTSCRPARHGRHAGTRGTAARGKSRRWTRRIDRGRRATVKPVEPCPHIHAHPPPCPQSPLTARAQLRDG